MSDRTGRAEYAQNADLGPESLCFSWFWHDGQFGIVVCEPQPGKYLLEYRHTGGFYQRVHPIEAFMGDDDEWLFFDSFADLRARTFRPDLEEA